MTDEPRAGAGAGGARARRAAEARAAAATAKHPPHTPAWHAELAILGLVARPLPDGGRPSGGGAAHPGRPPVPRDPDGRARRPRTGLGRYALPGGLAPRARQPGRI